MSNRDTGVYEFLYLRNGNTNQFLDYEVFLKLYESHLSRFHLNDSDNLFYMNVAFLKEVVDGFEYYHDLFIGNVEVFWFDIAQYTADVYYDLLVRKLNGDENLTSAEQVFMATVSCNNHMINENIIDRYAGIANKMVYNSCKVNKVYEKRNVKGN